MTEWMAKVLESKRQTRNRLAELPFSEKVKILEQLRDRSSLIASSDLRQRFENRPGGKQALDKKPLPTRI